jgi:hypothetical protein
LPRFLSPPATLSLLPILGEGKGLGMGRGGHSFITIFIALLG